MAAGASEAASQVPGVSELPAPYVVTGVGLAVKVFGVHLRNLFRPICQRRTRMLVLQL